MFLHDYRRNLIFTIPIQHVRIVQIMSQFHPNCLVTLAHKQLSEDKLGLTDSLCVCWFAG